MLRLQTSRLKDDVPLRPVEDLSELSAEERGELKRLAAAAGPIEMVMYSDLSSSGRYGRTRLL